MVATGRAGRIVRYAVIGGAVLAAVAGVGVLRKYHEATKIDRSVPKVVVREYIDAALVRRESGREDLFTCSDPTGLAPIVALRDELVADAARGVATQVVLTSALEIGDGSKVDASLQLNQGSGLHIDRRTQHWVFGMKDEDGWRVCSAEQIPDPTPTPSTQPTTS